MNTSAQSPLAFSHSHEVASQPRTVGLGGEERALSPLSLIIEAASGPSVRVALPLEGTLVVGGGWARPEEGASEPDEIRVDVADPTVSARHARIEVRRGRARIVDLGSKNGTWMGGARIEAASLDVGMCAMVGRSSLAIEAVGTRSGGSMQVGEVGEEDGDEEPPASSPRTRREHDGEVLPGAIGRALSMRRMAAAVRVYAQLSAPVLVRGESGSGKEVVARALHSLSGRKNGPFQAINLGALPRELAEAELFGHERGAFTGAAAARAGVFELAHGGTLLLDELGELPLDMQAKLLRVLETGEVRRLGARAPRAVDVRVVAATWSPLEQRIEEGTFREDLFHRIAVLVVDVPPLRERRADIAALAGALLARSRSELGEKVLTQAAVSRLVSEAWPGNVRELRNVVYRAAACVQGTSIGADDIARALRNRPSSAPPPRPVRPTRDADDAALLVRHHGSIAAAARAIGVPRETMRDWVRAAHAQGTPR